MTQSANTNVASQDDASTLSFVNPGEIDIRAAITLGVNAKVEGGSPIGYFGTGLKYVIAQAVAAGATIEIWSGETRYTFGSTLMTIRDKEFSVVEMNGSPLAFTTEFGKTWKPWMFYRELWCNAKDEGGDVQSGASVPAAGFTTIRVWNWPELIEAHQTRSEFILEGTPAYRFEGIELHTPPRTAIFYRGLRVRIAERQPKFTYNLHSPVTLTEDRSMNGAYPLWLALSQALCLADEAKFPTRLLRPMLLAGDDTFEHSMDWDNYQPTNERFNTLVAELWKNFPHTINKSAVAAARRNAPTLFSEDYVSVDPTAMELKAIEKAKRFLAAIGRPITHEIIVVETFGSDNIFGEAKNNKIYIARTTFDKGVKYVASTLLEEEIHLARGLDDCTRDMQNHLFDLIVRLGEQVWGELL